MREHLINLIANARNELDDTDSPNRESRLAEALFKLTKAVDELIRSPENSENLESFFSQPSV